MLYILVNVDKVNINYGYHGNNTQNPHKINIANWTFKLKRKNATVLVIYPTSLLTCMVTFLLRVHLYYIRDAEFTLAHEIWWKYFHRNRWSGCLNSDAGLSLSHLSPETRIEEKFTWPLRIVIWLVTHKKNS